MRRKLTSYYFIILIVFCQVFVNSAGVSAVNTENFYFDDFSADYYLSRNSDGSSKLKVVENFTTIFPDYNQNKGICREIPFTSYGGKNITLKESDINKIEVLRNGLTEPIYSIEKVNRYFQVCTGDDNYVLGKQIYTFSYEFSNVIGDFTSYQELYWDTNGNGSVQKYNSLTARVHVDEDILDDLGDEAWCYVGQYGDSGQDRCTISRTEDGFIFKTGLLDKYENLTFDIEFKKGTFVVPEPMINYFLIFALIGIFGVCLAIIIYIVRAYLKIKDKVDYFKGFFVKPEYQPNPKYRLSELAELYTGKKKDVKVALLLDLVVRKKIELISEDKKKWSFRVLETEGMTDEELILLKILKGGNDIKDQETIPIVSRGVSTELVKLNRKFYSTIKKELIADKLVEPKYNMGEFGGSSLLTSLISNLVFIYPFSAFMISGTIVSFTNQEMDGYVIFMKEFIYLTWIILFLTFLIWTVLNAKVKQFKNITKDGIVAEKYMEGMELYIRMAEKDRINFLQSVNGADVSARGVVKLYEKLLPYAAVFGLEESWMKEMTKYCRVNEIEAPDYLMAGFAASEISRMMSRAVYIANSSTRMSSSGGGSSSSYSGSGGGGFSGGGGGGGGVSGR